MRICWFDKPLTCQTAVNIKRTDLDGSLERDTSVLRKASSASQIDGPTGKIGEDAIDWPAVQPRRQMPRLRGEADERHANGGSVDDPGLVVPGIENGSAIHDGVEHPAVGPAADRVGGDKAHRRCLAGEQAPPCLLKPVADQIGLRRNAPFKGF
jgi:hypothetical protein